MYIIVQSTKITLVHPKYTFPSNATALYIHLKSTRRFIRFDKISQIRITPVKKKIFSRQKWLRKISLKNVGFTYKVKFFTTKSVLQSDLFLLHNFGTKCIF